MVAEVHRLYWLLELEDQPGQVQLEILLQHLELLHYWLEQQV